MSKQIWVPIERVERPDFRKDVLIRVKPRVGFTYASKAGKITIEITALKGESTFKAKVIASQTDRHAVGKVLEVEEIAFYGNHYEKL